MTDSVTNASVSCTNAYTRCHKQDSKPEYLLFAFPSLSQVNSGLIYKAQIHIAHVFCKCKQSKYLHLVSANLNPCTVELKLAERNTAQGINQLLTHVVNKGRADRNREQSDKMMSSQVCCFLFHWNCYFPEADKNQFSCPASQGCVRAV